MNQSAGPLVDDCDPAFLISVFLSFQLDVYVRGFRGTTRIVAARARLPIIGGEIRAAFVFRSIRTGTPTWIWSVIVDDAPYVRAYNGQDSRWYQAALRQKAGRIMAAGMTIEVGFEPVEGRGGDALQGRVKWLHHSEMGRCGDHRLRRL